jgi:uncharacterized protein (DUF2141 family)
MEMIGRIAVIGAALSLMASAAQAATLTVRVHDVASSKGAVLAALCDEANFLKNCQRMTFAPAARGDMTLVFSEVPPGKWAVMMFHDENGDQEMNRSKLGVPTEGGAFSRDAVGHQGPPAFADAAIIVGAKDQAIDVTMTYY